MKQRQIEVLKALCVRPRGLQWFTASKQLSERAALLYLHDLALRGYAAEPIKGSLSWQITEAGRAFLANLPAPVEYRNLGPLAQRANYVPPVWGNTRAGARQFLDLPSRGMGT